MPYVGFGQGHDGPGERADDDEEVHLGDHRAGHRDYRQQPDHQQGLLPPGAGLPGQEELGARLLTARAGEISLTSLYCPNGKHLEHDDYPRKLAWFDDLTAHLEASGTAGSAAVVAGDFNTFWGENEIYLFMKAAGLRSANTNSIPTYPSRAPRKELDFVLYQDGISVTGFEVPDVRHSDHLPLVCDFELA